jgi:hypothetical protein
MVDGSDIPISEDYEQYEVEILSDIGTHVRTIVVDGQTEASYSAADQIGDGFDAGQPINVKVYQMSATLGRGNAASGVV